MSFKRSSYFDMRATAFSEVLESEEKTEQEDAKYGIPKPFELANFVFEKYGDEAADYISDQIYLCAKAGRINAVFYYTCVMVELQKPTLTRICKREVALTFERHWRKKDS